VSIEAILLRIECRFVILLRPFGRRYLLCLMGLRTYENPGMTVTSSPTFVSSASTNWIHSQSQLHYNLQKSYLIPCVSAGRHEGPILSLCFTLHLFVSPTGRRHKETGIKCDVSPLSLLLLHSLPDTSNFYLSHLILLIHIKPQIPKLFLLTQSATVTSITREVLDNESSFKRGMCQRSRKDF